MKKLEILKLFTDPVFKYKLDDYQELNNQLSKYIYELRENDKEGLKRSNKGGWHSQNFLLTDINSIQYKFGVKLHEYIINAFQNFGWKVENKNIRISEMWAIINKKDDFNVVHTHPNSLLSAAYYVKAPNNCGRFQIEDLNIVKRHASPLIANQNELNMNVAGLEISEGDLLIFPGYLPHKVARNETDDDRIVISFNVDTK